MIDDSDEHRPEGLTINHLSYPNIGRQHLNARLVCVASNTNLTPPNNKAVILDVNCKLNCFWDFCDSIKYFLIQFVNLVKPVAVHILTKEKFVSADKRYDVECKSSGSRPEAGITWFKGTRAIKRQAKNVRRNFFILCLHVLCLPLDQSHKVFCLKDNFEQIMFKQKWV